MGILRITLALSLSIRGSKPTRELSADGRALKSNLCTFHDEVSQGIDGSLKMFVRARFCQTCGKHLVDVCGCIKLFLIKNIGWLVWGGI